MGAKILTVYIAETIRLKVTLYKVILGNLLFPFSVGTVSLPSLG